MEYRLLKGAALLLAAGTLLFWSDGKSNLDQAANCLRPARLVRLIRSPPINALLQLRIKPQSDGLSYASWRTSSAAFFSVISY
jgi:hypothetical protein